MKHLKTSLIACCMVLMAVAANAQDKIFKKNGEIIEAKVSEINGDHVVFKRFDNLEGPEYSIPKADVARIKYTNGTEDIFEENNDRIGAKTAEVKANIAANKNILALAPMVFTESGWGLSLSWERRLDKTGWVSFILPAVVSFSGYQPSYTSPETRFNSMYYLMPGIKIYTNINSSSRAKLSVGPSLILGLGTSNNGTDYYNSNVAVPQTHVVMGAMANIGFNFFATEKVYLGGEYGMGFSYLNEYNGISQGSAFLTQLTFKIGYRF